MSYSSIYSTGGNVVQLLAVVQLVTSITLKKSSTGISKESQLLFALSLILGYAECDVRYYMVGYEVAIKIIQTVATAVMLYLIFCKFPSQSCQIKSVYAYALLVIFILAVFCNGEYMRATTIIWAASAYLEAVAMVPQFIVYLKNNEIPSNVVIYAILLTLSKFLHILSYLICSGRFYAFCIAGTSIHFALNVTFFVFLICKQKKLIMLYKTNNNKLTVVFKCIKVSENSYLQEINVPHDVSESSKNNSNIMDFVIESFKNTDVEKENTEIHTDTNFKDDKKDLNYLNNSKENCLQDQQNKIKNVNINIPTDEK